MQKEKRIRRTPEEARRLILDAAEKVLGGQGPAGLRLQDVARAAGVSHPTILHHFGNREGLVRALNARATEHLARSMLEQMGQPDSGLNGVARAFAAYRDGMAQRTVWLLQAGALPPAGQPPLLRDVLDAMQTLRGRFARPGHEPQIADSVHVVNLVAVAALGDALIGARLRQSVGIAEPEGTQAFEKFLSELISTYLESKA